jgi:biopolymer transport protein TolQ
MNITPILMTDTADQLSMIALILEADIIVQSVLFILLGMSIMCWVIILKKHKLLQNAQQQTDEFLHDFWNAKKLEDIYEELSQYKESPVANVFQRAYIELDKLNRLNKQSFLDSESNLERAMRRASSDEQTKLESLITFLATTGSTAPFIGLFGTVWGILRAFQKIGATGQASIQTVGPDIAHALIATAVGLAAAIPAVIAYNFINRKIKVLRKEMENFSSDFLNIVKRSNMSR